MRHELQSPGLEALDFVRDGLASVNIATASLADLRRLRELLGAARAAQKVRLAAALAESRLRLDHERCRLTRAQVRTASARAKLVELERNRVAEAAERRAEKAKEAESSERLLERLTGPSVTSSRTESE